MNGAEVDYILGACALGALDSDAWYTPPWIFEGLGLTFDLDVASPAVPLPWVPALERYTVADDGLSMPWHGLVWCNPPYSAPTAWCHKWAEHPEGCLLIRADLSTGGPFVAFTAASSVYVPRKRIQFVNGHGAGSGSVNFSSLLLGRGPRADAAIQRLAAQFGGSGRALCSVERESINATDWADFDEVRFGSES